MLEVVGRREYIVGWVSNVLGTQRFVVLVLFICPPSFLFIVKLALPCFIA